MSLRFPLSNIAITGQDTPAAFLTKQLDPLFILETTSAELVLDVHDSMEITEESAEPPTKPRGKIVIDEKLHAALRLPMLAS